MTNTLVIGEFVEFIYCGCGCKMTRPKYDIQGRIRKYIQRHTEKKSNNRKQLVKERQLHNRAQRILRNSGILECQAKSNLCNGILESHHIDKNKSNNKLSNLWLLCRTHHRSADIRNFKTLEDFNILNNIVFIMSSNKRRYRIVRC